MEFGSIESWVLRRAVNAERPRLEARRFRTSASAPFVGTPRQPQLRLSLFRPLWVGWRSVAKVDRGLLPKNPHNHASSESKMVIVSPANISNALFPSSVTCSLT